MKRRRNRAGIPGVLSAKEIQSKRPGLGFIGAVDRSHKLKEWQISAFAREHDGRGFMVFLPHAAKRNYYAIIHRETAQGPYQHEWRVTYFDDDGPIGHGYGGNWSKKSDRPGGYMAILRRLVREDGADLRGAMFQ